MGWVQKTNTAVAKSFVGMWFRLDHSGHPKERKGTRFLTEIRAGLATFFAMAYIISVNASIVASTGGTCVCENASGTADPYCTTVDTQAYEDYEACRQILNRDLVTATAAIGALSSFSMGIFANMPLALAPGMGLNAYFAYQVVGQNGQGVVPYRLALTAVFVEGLIFVALSILGIRQWLARMIPLSLKIASGAGIGLYLALIGLTYNAGIGAISSGSSDPLELAGCVPALLDPVTGICTSGKMRNPTMWLGIFAGGMLTAFLMMYRVKGAIIVGVLAVSIISWPRNTSVTAFPYTDSGDSAFEFFKKVVSFHPIKKVLVAQDWNITGPHAGQFALALITFLYVDILDATGTLYSMARFCGVMDEDTQDFEGSAVAYVVDAFSISFGALFGCPPVTVFIESGAGISEGGGTGITACVTGLCFLISIVFAPIFASIPAWATGCTLILVGAMMARAVTDINWRYIGDSVPAFVTLAVMPFTYSIAYGMVTGIVTYTILNTGAWLLMKVSAGRFIPYDYEQKDYWSYKGRGGLLPGWLKRLARGKRDFWRDYDFDAEGLSSHDPNSLSIKRGDSTANRASSASARSDEADLPVTGNRTWELSVMGIMAAYNFRANSSSTSPEASMMSSPGGAPNTDS